MFKDQKFEAGEEFTCDFLSNIYSKIFLSDHVILDQGERFNELLMIQEGNVSCSLRLDPNDMESMQEFFILPTYSYFGDYQILFDLKSQITYKNISSKVLMCLCLSRDKFIELMDDYPEARKFYIERAWLRRIEFRRR